ncbi:hypothetical protein [Pseudomonas aeruginosa]|nr:hypothetical protein [Pseudomonas aeruginosa]MBS9730394.1 hypothetical protein [Pseudomonas aeruginosa]MDH1421402.1 hypothetical protein [Pseudomonas aeruginosa]TQH48095.1 hypothetical protein FLI59_32655 [Pseudomonas aeruginosa]HDU8983435.1 hypothetical protein [Pseudomonas aeruginosa]
MDSKLGWETQSPDTAISRHVTYWFTSRENQGKLIGGVPSFYMIFKDFAQYPDQMVEQVQDKFKAYLEELFDEVMVGVSRQNVTGSVNNYRLILTARVVVDNMKYDLAQTILITGELYKVLDLERLKR